MRFKKKVGVYMAWLVLGLVVIVGLHGLLLGLALVDKAVGTLQRCTLWAVDAFIGLGD